MAAADEAGRSSQYERYIRSHRWLTVKRAWYSLHGAYCRACGSTAMPHLHHKTYERLGLELDGDLVALCEWCHDQLHDEQRASGESLADATDRFVERESRLPAHARAISQAAANRRRANETRRAAPKR